MPAIECPGVRLLCLRNSEGSRGSSSSPGTNAAHTVRQTPADHPIVQRRSIYRPRQLHGLAVLQSAGSARFLEFAISYSSCSSSGDSLIQKVHTSTSLLME